MKLTKEMFNDALQAGREGKLGYFDIGFSATSYASFGTYGMSIIRVKNNGRSLLRKSVGDWQNKTLAEINKELNSQEWEGEHK